MAGSPTNPVHVLRLSPHSRLFIVFLGFLAALPPLAIDMGLPALAAVSTALDTSPARASLTLGCFLAGFATTPLVCGPLADRFGRRPVLLTGCALFTAAGVACALAPSIDALLFWRVAAGAGAGACSVLVFAIIRDIFDAHEARARLSYVNAIIGIAPMAAPTLGVWVLMLGDWRAIYAFLGVAGAALLLIAGLGFGESLPPERRRSLHPGSLLAGYRRVLQSRGPLGNALVNALSFGCLFAYVSGSPIVLMELLGVSSGAYAGWFALTSLGLIAGALLNGRLSRHRVSPVWPLAGGLALAVTVSVGLFLLTLADTLSVATLMPPLVVNSIAMGMLRPNAVHGVLQPLPDIAGVAAAVMSFLQMLCGAVSGALVAALYDGHSALAMTAVMAGFAVAAAAVYGCMVRPAERQHAIER